MPLSNPFQKKCSICGALNVTKATCPCNPDFPKNPDWDNHNWKKACPEKKSAKPKFQSEAARRLMLALKWYDRVPEGSTKKVIEDFKKAYPDFIKAYESSEEYKRDIEGWMGRDNECEETRYPWFPAYNVDYINAVSQGWEKQYKEKIIAEDTKEFLAFVDNMLKAEDIE